MENVATASSAPSNSVGPDDGTTKSRLQIARDVAASRNGDEAGLKGTFDQLLKNPFFTAGFGLAGLGAAAAVARRGFTRAAALLKRRLLVEVEITRHDVSYQWFLHWMSAHHHSSLSDLSAQRTGGILDRLVQRITRLHYLSMQSTQMTQGDGARHTNFALVPGQGNHLLRYKNAFIAVTRAREIRATDMANGKPFETITLKTLYAQRHVFETLFQEAHALAMRAQEGKTTIYTSWGTEWKPFGEAKRKRPIDSVVLEKGLKERIVTDVQVFLKARNWYLDRGIPYRRGYLLYGPPGTGKSSFIQALAGELDFSIAMLNVSERGLTDDRLAHLLANIPSRTIVLLEDADAAFVNRTQSDEHGYRGATVTFSGLLNALDGVASSEERIVFLTTNHIERLDEALIRPGRVDMTVRLGEATVWQVEQLWDRFYASHDVDGAIKQQFVAKLQSLGLLGRVSTAELQGLFLFNKDDALGAVSMAEGLKPNHGKRQVATT